MYPKPLFPDGFHGAFSLNPLHRMPETGLRRLSRIQASVKYYYIDFGSSSMFSSYEEREHVPLMAAVWLPAEFLNNKGARLDPFKQDVFALGMTLIRELKMIDDDPTKRPTIAEVRKNFDMLLRSVKPAQMRRRIGWTWVSGRTSRERIWDVWEYFKLLRDARKYGLPKDLFPAETAS
ncbi:hypothetical protein CALCODRAFT_57428 [Calocera cornea HHB12733]|uniref:Protein kinase domain-containing protein n=1 Tax=Calocera cornea HHB12733 TaxID=1353952 RepID=A0A165IUV5_9BASI|nr:hypothetical protein CALCODRAFT_57428 [Calocera cornea HHB12733]